jgi:hypothetical protein
MTGPTPIRSVLAAVMLATFGTAMNAQPLSFENRDTITLDRPVLTDTARSATLPERLNHLKIEPDYELLFQSQPQLRDILRRYPGLEKAKPSENAAIIERFPGVTREMLEALQHFKRTGLPAKVAIDPGMLAPRFTRVLPQHDRFLENALQRPTLDLDRSIGNQTTFQTVSPELAIAIEMGKPEAREWRTRVRDASAYELDALSTCRNAIWALFETTCGGDPVCEFETEYANRCLNAPNSTTAATCVEAVDTYHDLCFGGTCPIPDVNWPAVTIGRPGDAACSGALVEDGAGGTVLATVDHCEPYVGEGAMTRSGQSGYVSAPLSANAAAVLGLTDKMRGYHIPSDRVGDGSASAPPEEYAVTALLAYNRILDLRNQVVARFGLNTGRTVPLSCDASALCTVIDVRPDGELDHTCQSTRGGSGGALVQFIDGKPRVVGLNMGARTPGVVAFNLGVAIRK